MARYKSGSRHTLLLYQRLYDRVWRVALLFGALLLVIWSAGEFFEINYFHQNIQTWVLVFGILSTFLGLIAMFARRMCYVQARKDHLFVATPFFPLRISYRRILTSRPSSLPQVFPINSTTRTMKRNLQPFYGKTVLLVEMKGTPMHPRILRFFLSSYVFIETPPRLIFIINDWMKLSTEIDSYLGVWRQEFSQNRDVKKRRSFRL